MTAEESLGSVPSHAYAHQLPKGAPLQAEPAIQSALRVGDGRQVLRSIADCKGLKILQLAHVTEHNLRAFPFDPWAQTSDVSHGFSTKGTA